VSPTEGPVAKAPSAFAECTVLALVGLMGSLVSKIAVPGEWHEASDHWLVPTLGLIALSAGLLLSILTGRALRNREEGRKRRAVSTEL
jgi:protein-S-isoprenylcysteine O-methyltransferase Ste14